MTQSCGLLLAALCVGFFFVFIGFAGFFGIFIFILIFDFHFILLGRILVIGFAGGAFCGFFLILRFLSFTAFFIPAL